MSSPIDIDGDVDMSSSTTFASNLSIPQNGGHHNTYPYIEHTATAYAPSLCCMCGVSMPFNPSHMCVECLRAEVDITENISKSIVLLTCKDCKRYCFHKWLVCEAESKELLAHCLKKIRGLNKVRLIDAQFVWTEPHSKRIKVKVTIQKEVGNGTIMQQAFTVQFIVQSNQCDDCKRLWTPHTWNARVQLRQRTKHKRTFLYLEQLILKNDAHESVINIMEQPDGLDFFFSSRPQAQKFVNFVSSYFSTKSRASKELISQDANSNTFYHKYTICAEICSVCKDDLVWLPRKLASHYGGISQFQLCSNVTTSLHLVDPFTLRSVDVSSEKYWRYPFKAVLSRENLTEFIVLDIEWLEDSSHPQYKLLKHSKYRLAVCEIARASDFGYNDERISVRCHIGGMLKTGDWCLGYELEKINLGAFEEEVELQAEQLQCSVILVKKKKKKQRNKNRPFKLQWLSKQQADDRGGKQRGIDREDIADFEDDLEEDAEMRKEVNLIRNPTFDQTQYEVDSDDDAIKLEELLEGLTLNVTDEL